MIFHSYVSLAEGIFLRFEFWPISRWGQEFEELGGSTKQIIVVVMALELASLNRGYREKVPFFRGATYARDKSAAPGLPQGLPNNVVSHDLELRKTQCKPTERYGGFHGHGDIPSSLDGLFPWENPTKMIFRHPLLVGGIPTSLKNMKVS